MFMVMRFVRAFRGAVDRPGRSVPVPTVENRDPFVNLVQTHCIQCMQRSAPSTAASRPKRWVRFTNFVLGSPPPPACVFVKSESY